MSRFCIVGGFCLPVLLMMLGCEEPRVEKYTAAREKSPTDIGRLESYKLPEDWKRAEKLAPFSLATFHVGEGKKPVTVTMTREPGDFGGLLSNIDRWRGKIGLPEVDEKQLMESVKWLNVDGQKTPYVDLSNSAKKEADRILGVYARRGPVTWVFKMQGSPEQVDVHKPAFETFVESMKFAGSGARDG